MARSDAPGSLLVMVLALLVAAPAPRTRAPATKIIRDCDDDGKLEGNYTPSRDPRRAQQPPADIDEYSDCRDVLARALGGSGDRGGVGGGGRRRRARRRRRRRRHGRPRGP